MRKLIAAALMLTTALAGAQKSPKNVIIMIGDGMGYNTVAMQVLDSKGQSSFERFHSIGSIKTYCADGKITDSGAGGTAFAIGEKTYNGAIGVDVNRQPKPNLLEIAAKNHQKTGIVVTCALTHATPAAFSAHQPKRNLYEAIAADVVSSNVDLLVGGGLDHFTKRKDGRNLVQEAQTKGYAYYSDTTAFFASAGSRSLVILANEHLKPANEGRGNYLPRAVEKSISLLKGSKKGFMLMVEGSQIDWACHNNKTDYLRAEMQDFDRAVAAALNFAEKDGNTLVLVFADHETGGVTLPPAEANSLSEEYGDYTVKYSTGAHSGTLIPVFAFGPGADKFQGIYQNAEIFHKLLTVKGWR